MANIPNMDETGWYTRIVQLGILPFNLHYIIRMISWFFVRLLPPGAFIHGNANEC